MNKFFNHSLLISASVACLALASACGGSGDDDDDSSGGMGGSGGAGASGGTGGTGTGNVTLIPSSTGWVDKMDVGNDVGVQGSWYPYGDQYGDGPGDAKCIKIGQHMPSECAQIITPEPPPMTGYPNTNGEMHTEGTVEQVLACVPGSPAVVMMTSGCPTFDYSNMWGAGIGFDLNANKGKPEGDGAKKMWNPADFGVIGVSFEIDVVPLPGLRVEFPMLLQDADAMADGLPAGSTTDDHSAGAPYWGAQKKGDKMYPGSPVMPGKNTIMFNPTDIQAANLAAYAYDPARMLGIQFHVPTNSSAGGTYSFTVKNLTFIRTL
jgi:hypothetical protein